MLEIPVTTNGCEFCEDSLHSRACVGTPNAMLQSYDPMNAILTRDCREYSSYSRSSVGNPDLKNVNMFIKVRSLYYAAVHRLHSEFLECSEDSL